MQNMSVLRERERDLCQVDIGMEYIRLMQDCLAQQILKAGQG